MRTENFHYWTEEDGDCDPITYVCVFAGRFLKAATLPLLWAAVCEQVQGTQWTSGNVPQALAA